MYPWMKNICHILNSEWKCRVKSILTLCTGLTLPYLKRNYADCKLTSMINTWHKIKNIWENRSIRLKITLYLYDLSYPCNIQCLLPSKHVDSPLRNPTFRISLNNIDYLAKDKLKQRRKMLTTCGLNTKNLDLWAGPTTEVHDSWTSHQVWQI